MIEAPTAAPADSSAGAALFLNPSFFPNAPHPSLAAQSAVAGRNEGVHGSPDVSSDREPFPQGTIFTVPKISLALTIRNVRNRRYPQHPSPQAMIRHPKP